MYLPKKSLRLLPDRIIATCNCSSHYKRKPWKGFKVEEPCVIFCHGKKTKPLLRHLNKCWMVSQPRHLNKCWMVSQPPPPPSPFSPPSPNTVQNILKYQWYQSNPYACLWLGSVKITYFVKINPKKSVHYYPWFCPKIVIL